MFAAANWDPQVGAEKGRTMAPDNELCSPHWASFIIGNQSSTMRWLS